MRTPTVPAPVVKNVRPIPYASLETFTESVYIQRTKPV